MLEDEGIEHKPFRLGVDHPAALSCPHVELVYLRQLLGNASEDVVVEVPGLRQVLDVP